MLDEACAAAGVSFAVVGRALGVDESRVRQLRPAFDRLRLLPDGVWREIVRLRSVDDAPASGLPIAEHIARLGSEFGDVAREYIAAGSDIDDDEERRLDRELAQLGAAVERARRDLRARGRR